MAAMGNVAEENELRLLFAQQGVDGAELPVEVIQQVIEWCSGNRDNASDACPETPDMT